MGAGINTASVKSKNVEHSITNLNAIISASGYLHKSGATVSLPCISASTGAVIANVAADATKVYFGATEGDWSSYTLYAILKYTKTTG